MRPLILMENQMKRLLGFVALLLVVCFATPSMAAWNVRQKDNGSATLIDGNSIEVPYSGQAYVVQITSVGSAQTYFVATHNPGRVRKIYVTSQGAFASGSAAPAYIFKASTGTAVANQFRPISVGATLTMITTSQGSVSSLSPSDSNNEVAQGSVIAIVPSVITGTAGVSATFTIVVE